MFFNYLLPPPVQGGADRDLRDANTRGSPPGNRDRRTAAWSQHSPDHSDRRTTCAAGGTVPYSLKCSHLHNPQGPWSEPAIRCSPSLHLNERQAVQETARYRAHPREAPARLRKNEERETRGVCFNLLLPFGTANASYIRRRLRASALSLCQRSLCISLPT